METHRWMFKAETYVIWIINFITVRLQKSLQLNTLLLTVDILSKGMVELFDLCIVVSIFTWQRTNLHWCRRWIAIVLVSCKCFFALSIICFKYTLTEILLLLLFKLDPLLSTKVARSNHHIRNWPSVNWPVVEPLAVNIPSAERRRVIWVSFSHALYFVKV